MARSIIKKEHKISTKADLAKLLGKKNFRPVLCPAKKTVIGFKKDDPQAVRVHKMLCDMSVNQRLAYVSKVVTLYVEDGNDSVLDKQLARIFLADASEQYRDSGFDSRILDNTFLLMR